MPISVTLDVSVLEKLGLAVDAGLEEALLKYGEQIVVDAKSRCPVSALDTDGHVHLRDTIEAEETGPLEVTIHDGKEYGIFVEAGTRRMAARPWLTPAIDAAAGRLPGVVASAVERVAVASGGKGQALAEPQS